MKIRYFEILKIQTVQTRERGVPMIIKRTDGRTSAEVGDVSRYFGFYRVSRSITSMRLLFVAYLSFMRFH